MAVSARVLHPSQATTRQEARPAAKIIPFQGRRREPLEEPIAGRANAQVIVLLPTLNSPKEQPSVRPSAQIIAFPAQDARPISKPTKSHEAEICQAIKIESVREAKAKGQFTRKSEEALNINYQLAWLVWFRYVEIMLSMGIRVSEFLKRVEFHDQIKRGR
ncbi:MAG: hypothetical protein PHC52_12430 [Syntrophales bacterium]|nr:hypothetical protein [Candidatus ainarchaeum sp.]MDD5096325.1 hypothetical protein [Candidatus ainarchaeum sp.]MDD5533592.1 hypothetical protein [Syntrophales bacterium]